MLFGMENKKRIFFFIKPPKHNISITFLYIKKKKNENKKCRVTVDVKHF